MIDSILQTIQIPFLGVALATFVDTFIFTGYIFYGFAFLAGAAALYASGVITLADILIGGYIGTVLASLFNFFLGRYGSNIPFIAKRLESPAADRVRTFLVGRNLFVTLLICRSITFLRPAYSIVLGALGIAPRRFIIYELLLAFCWLFFWVGVMLVGIDTFHAVREWMRS